jgi:oligoribonuclease NrnB/cAMP/cGMP phosphodiesterase (DHH superfamily)
MKTLCIYHGNCADGFGAAWVVRKALGMGHVDFHAGTYQDAPPDVTGRDVLLVDFSYKRAVMAEVVAKANSVKVLDHHKTAAEDLACRCSRPARFAEPVDMERSGAGITWDHFLPRRDTRPCSSITSRIATCGASSCNRTREIQAAVFSYPYDFEIWDRLVRFI